jgi:dihydrolipoamide dehydrogenase
MSALKGNPRARCTGETEGLVKIIGEARTDRLLGLHIISEHASEMIAEGMLAIQTRATLQDIAYAPYAHPTLSEAIREAAFNALGEPLHDG